MAHQSCFILASLLPLLHTFLYKEQCVKCDLRLANCVASNKDFTIDRGFELTQHKKKSCVYPTEKKTRISTSQNNTLKSFSLVAVIMFVQENKVGQELWSGLEATWHSTTHNHQMKPSCPLKQDGHIQTAFWKRSLTQAVPKIIPGHYLGEYELAHTKIRPVCANKKCGQSQYSAQAHAPT